MLLQKRRRAVNVGLFMALMIAVLACTRYFRPVKFDPESLEASANFISTNSPVKYFILHKGSQTYALKDIAVDKEKLTLIGKLSAVDPSHFTYINAKRHRFTYNSQTRDVLSEIHFYVNNSAAIDTIGSLAMPLSQIEKIEVIERDKGLTTITYVLGGIGIAIVAIVAIAAATSCPFVSVDDGEGFHLQAELFGGAVNRQLERMDYVPLKAFPVNGEYRIRISNELKEKQYTNFADLLVVEHPEDLQVIPTADGKLCQVSDPQTPVMARLNDKKDVLKLVSAQDEFFTGFADTSHTSGINELNLTFKRKENAEKGKLILRLKNSYWLDYLYGEFIRHFGDYYTTWAAQEQFKPAAEMNRWNEEQQIPLRISIKTGKEWKEIQKLKTVGPLANRSVVIPLELDANSNEPVNIKLSTGFMFWEVDYAAVDFSNDQPVSVIRLKPFFAEDQNGNSVVDGIVDNDQKYLTQPEDGDWAVLKYKFNQKAKPGNAFSVILHTGGYYEPIGDSGRPDVAFLQKFKEPGYFPIFSLNHFQQLIKQPTLATNK